MKKVFSVSIEIWQDEWKFGRTRNSSGNTSQRQVFQQREHLLKAADKYIH